MSLGSSPPPGPCTPAPSTQHLPSRACLQCPSLSITSGCSYQEPQHSAFTSSGLWLYLFSASQQILIYNWSMSKSDQVPGSWSFPILKEITSVQKPWPPSPKVSTWKATPPPAQGYTNVCTLYPNQWFYCKTSFLYSLISLLLPFTVIDVGTQKTKMSNSCMFHC